MLKCFHTPSTEKSIPITLITQKDFSSWREQQARVIKNWLTTTGFKPEEQSFWLLPGEDGNFSQVVCIVAEKNNFWCVGNLPMSLPEGHYHLELEPNLQNDFAIAWGLGAYQFTKYKNATRKPAQLVLPKACDVPHIHNVVESIYLVRDLINTPADHMGPTELSEVADQLCEKYHAKIKHIIGDDLLKNNYATIHTVGRASDDAPRLLDIHWGDKKHPLVTLVGKGVCFDTGGLDLKNSSSMMLMKKDMAGAAHCLGLARMVMQANLPIQLRILIPVVENAVSGNAFRPGDVIKTRKGITVEIGNTDAEGRLILADALTEAVSDKPDLLIDIATLTGAARIALGTDLPALFCNQDTVATALLKTASDKRDPLWRMPLFDAYRDALSSNIADINNCSQDGYAGSITAALFLKEFVPNDIPWIHLDMMAWNVKPLPGRPQGGEAMTLRALFEYLKGTEL